DPGDGSQQRSSTPTGTGQQSFSDAFLLRLTSQGAFGNVATIGGPEFDQLNDVRLITSGDTVQGVVAIGPFSGGVSLGGDVGPIAGLGGLDVVVARWTSTLEPTWGRLLGTSINDVPTGVAVDSAGNITFGGAFQGTLDLDPGPGTTSVTALGESDGYLVT